MGKLIFVSLLFAFAIGTIVWATSSTGYFKSKRRIKRIVRRAVLLIITLVLTGIVVSFITMIDQFA
jgi:hypothetical protein